MSEHNVDDLTVNICRINFQ